MPTTTTTTTTTFSTTELILKAKEEIQEQVLFEDKYLSPEVQSNLPEGYKLYPLRSNDYDRGYLDVLKVLTEVGSHDIDTWNQQFQFMKKHNDTCKFLLSHTA